MTAIRTATVLSHRRPAETSPAIAELRQLARASGTVLRFSEEETFYRSLRSTIATMQRHGLQCDARLASRDKIAFRLSTAPKAALPLLGWLYRQAYSVVLQTHKP